MKQILLFIAFMLLVTISLKATVHTVSNDVNNPAQYTSVQTAHDGASVGDTLLIYGSTTDYCTGLVGSAIYIKKRLCIIGAGYKPNNQFGNQTYISTINLDSVTGVYGASGTEIMGIKLSYINVGSGKLINHVIIHRNEIVGQINLSTMACKNWKLFNNIFTYSQSSFYQIQNSVNLLIANNIFEYSARIHQSNSTTLITNNLFLPKSNGWGVGSGCLSSCTNSTITNNIFYMRTATDVNCSQNTFTNNIGYGTTTIVTGTNMGSSNPITDPKFINIGTNNGFDYSDDYNLQSTSPAINAGSDGTDIGIYGGPYPWPEGYGSNYRYASMPNIPIIMKLNVNSTNIPQNTNLNFTIKARKGDE